MRRGAISLLMLAAACGDAAEPPPEAPLANRAPVADAGDDRPAEVGAPIMLDGTGSHDLDGDALTFAWRIAIAPERDGTTPPPELAGADLAHPVLTVHAKGAYVLELVVSDGRAGSVPDRVTIRAGIDNVPPVADAGPDFEAKLGFAMFLDGSRSHDANGDRLTHHWRSLSLPPASGAAPVEIFQPVAQLFPEHVGEYRFELRVHDGRVWSEPDEVVVTVSERGPPPQPLELDVHDLVADRTGTLLYASSPRPGDSTVVVIDPSIPAEVRRIPFAGPVGPLAIADDGAYLFVGRTDDGTITRVDLARGTPPLTWTIALADEAGPLLPVRLAAVPEASGAVLVSARSRDPASPSRRTLVMDAQSERSSALGPEVVISSLTPALRSGRLYAITDQYDGIVLYTLDVDFRGVHVASRVRMFSMGAFTEVVHAAGWLYTSAGLAIDTTTMIPARMDAQGTVAVDERQIYYVANDGPVSAGERSLKVFDRETRALVGTERLRLPLHQQFGTPARLVRWGPHGLAYVHQPAEDQPFEPSVAIVQSALVGR